MLTRRQLLLSAAAIGIPVAASIPLPLAGEPRNGLRFGLLQSRQPFMDPHDIAGSRERAFTAYRVLIRRSLEEHGPLDWIAGNAAPLSGPGPFSQPVLEKLALSEASTEVKWLKGFTEAHRMRLTLGGWWQGAGGGIAYRLLDFDNRGKCRALVPSERWVSEGVQLQMPAHCGTPSLSGFAAECGRLHHYGAWVEPLQGPAAPPGVPSVLLPASAVVGPDGQLIAHAGRQTESCLVVEV